jgi:hypothetical protein
MGIRSVEIDLLQNYRVWKRVTWRYLQLIDCPVVEILAQCLMTTGSGIFRRICVPLQLARETYPILNLGVNRDFVNASEEVGFEKS